MARYDRTGTKCSGRAQPGTVNLHKAVEERWPILEPAGIYVCRPVRGGASLSTHGEGRGDDEHLDQPGPGKANPAGAAIAQELVAKHEALGIQCVIFDRLIWSTLSPRWRAYGGVNPHLDHIHIEQHWGGALDLTLDQARRVLAASPSSPGGFLMALSEQQQSEVRDAVARVDARTEAILSAVARFDQVELPEIDAALAAVQVQLAKAAEPHDPVAFAQAVKDAFGTDVAKDFAKAFAEIIKSGAGG